MLAEGLAHGVVGTGDDHEVKVLAGTLQRCHHLHGRGGVYVVVELAHAEHQRALQSPGVLHVRAVHVAAVDGVAHPLLVPPDFVHAVVVAATGGIGGLVEVAMPEDGGHGVLPTGGAAVDAHAVDVHIGILSGGSLDPGDAVGQSGILQVLVAHLLELAGAERGGHGVELHHDEAQLGQLGHAPVPGAERLGHVLVAGAAVDVLDDGVLLLRVEVRGAQDDAPHVGDAVAAWGHEHLRGRPALGLEARDVGRLQRAQHLAVLAGAQHGDGRRGDGAVGVDEELHVVGVGDVVVALLGGEAGEMLAVETYSIIMNEIGVFLLGLRFGG